MTCFPHLTTLYEDATGVTAHISYLQTATIGKVMKFPGKFKNIVTLHDLIPIMLRIRSKVMWLKLQLILFNLT